MRFEVKGQEFFLAFVEDEKKLYLFAPTPTGMHRMPVYVDAVKYGHTPAWDAKALSS